MDRAGPSRSWLPRVPLHIKVMFSYLLVVGLVFLPTILYLRTLFRDDLRVAVTAELDQEASTLAARLERVDPQQLDAVIGLMMDAMPQRVTIIDASGRVLGDSAIAKSSAEDHSHRPEFKDALDHGVGRAVRFSASTNDERIYVARRFATDGVAKGVVRLSVPTKDVDRAFERGYQFINRAGAVGLSAAVLLSLVAAFVVSRPLRRIAESARAFAGGDFGHPIDVTSDDELGEAAQALRDLAARLRGTLITSGADRANLHALLDDLPCGVVLYDAGGLATVINGKARELCDLSPHDEHERMRELLAMPRHRSTVEQVHAQRRSRAVRPIKLPWGKKDDPELEGTWLSLYSEDGAPETGLILTRLEHDARIAALEGLVEKSVAALRKASATAGSADLAAELEIIAGEAERHKSHPAVAPGSVEALETMELCRMAASELKAQLASANVALEFVVAQPEIHLVEADGRSRGALRRILEVALAESAPGSTIRLHGDSTAKQVIFSLHCAGSKKLKLPGIGPLVHGIGGDVGTKAEGDGVELWLKLPRA